MSCFYVGDKLFCPPAEVVARAVETPLQFWAESWQGTSLQIFGMIALGLGAIWAISSIHDGINAWFKKVNSAVDRVNSGLLDNPPTTNDEEEDEEPHPTVIGN